MLFCQALPFSSCLDEKSSSLKRAQAALLDGPPPSDGGAWVTNAGPTESAPAPSMDVTSRFFGRSFSGTESVGGEPLFCWITRHYDGLSMEAKEELIRFVLSVEVQKGGMVVAKQLPAVDGADELPSYSAMSLIRLYDTTNESSWYKKKLTSITEALLSLRQGVAYGFPTAMQDKRWKETGEGTMKVFNLLGKEYDSQHQTIMRDNCHWYINLLGTDPSQQGRGQGSHLVRRISELADERGMDCYLEANGESNRRFYEKFGYRCEGSAVFQPPVEWNSAAAAGEHDTVTTYFMQRKADDKSA